MGRRILSNILALGGAQMVTMLAGIVTAAVLARALGPAVYGIIGFGVAILSYFGLLVNMGMDVHGVREIARRPTHGRRLVDMIVSTRLVLAAVCFAGLAAALPSLGWSDDVRDVLLIQGIGLFAIAVTVEFYFQAEQRMAPMALRQGAAAVLGAVAVLLLVRDPGDLRVAAAIPIAVHILTALVLFAYFRRLTATAAAPDGDLSRLTFIRRSAPMALIGVLMSIYINIDIIILGYMVSETELGLYAATARVAVIAVVIPNLIHSAFLPALSKAKGDDAAAAAAADNHARSVGFFGGAVGGAGMLFAPQIIDILFGAAYAGAVDAMRILMAHVLLFHLSAGFATPLVAWQCDKPFTAILAVGAALNVGLNFWLIPDFGIEGAAAATLVTQGLIWIGLMVLARKAYGLNHLGLTARTLIVTALSMAPVFWALQNWQGVGNAWGVAIIGGGAYALIYGTLAIAGRLISLAELRALLRRAG